MGSPGKEAMEHATKEDGPSAASGRQDLEELLPMISLEELGRRIHNPCELSKENYTEASLEDSLSHVPWRIQQSQRQQTENSDDGGRSSSSLPSYLDLRRQQNVNWATNQLEKGKTVFYSNPKKAEELFEEGLNLVPDHIDLLLEYGKLLSQMMNLPALGLAKVRKALELKPDHQVAKELFQRMRKGHALQNQQPVVKDDAPVPRQSSAYQDALFERSLLAEDNKAMNKGIDDDDSIDNESDDISSISREKRRRRKKDRKRKKKRRRRRSRSRSDDERSLASADASVEPDNDDPKNAGIESRDRSRRHRKKKGRRKRRGRSRSPSVSSRDDDDHEELLKKQDNQDNTKAEAQSDRERSSSDDDSSYGRRKKKHKHRKRRKKRRKGS